MSAVFKVDNQEFNLIVSRIQRNFAVTDTDKTGRTIDATLFRDIIGTFYNYTIEIKTKSNAMDEYNNFYEIISDPSKDFHVFEMPYGDSILTFEGYVANGRDELLKKTPTINYWNNLLFNIIAKEPQRRP